VNALLQEPHLPNGRCSRNGRSHSNRTQLDAPLLSLFERSRAPPVRRRKLAFWSQSLRTGLRPGGVWCGSAALQRPPAGGSASLVSAFALAFCFRPSGWGRVAPLPPSRLAQRVRGLGEPGGGGPSPLLFPPPPAEQRAEQRRLRRPEAAPPPRGGSAAESGSA
jgi:hypothetical protein